MREAIAVAAAGDTVVFASGVIGVIPLSGGELAIAKNLTIAGPGARKLVVSGSLSTRVFRIVGPAVVSISNVSIKDGTDTEGAGIRNDGTLTLTRCMIAGNIASNPNGGIFGGGRGAGILNYGPLTVRDCGIIGNFANGTNAYGAGMENYGTVTLLNTTLSNNQIHTDGTGYGAAIFQRGTKLTAINCTITGNYFHPGQFPNNLAVGGIAIDGYPQTVYLRNTIIARNRATRNPDVSGNYVSYGHNLIGDVGNNSRGWVASDITGTSTNLKDPGIQEFFNDNGGPTDTHAILPGSLAINAGDDVVQFAPYNLTNDQRGSGYPRKIGAHVDIGSFEYDPPQTSATLVVNTTAEHADGVCGSTDCTLLEALNATNANSDANTITFKDGMSGAIVNSVPVGLSILQPVTISGPGARVLAVSGNNASRVFQIDSGITATISGLTIRNGKARGADERDVVGAESGVGGGIYAAGRLTLRNCTLSGNAAEGGNGLFGGGGGATGGGVYNGATGIMTLNNCTLSGNAARGGWGGVAGANGGAAFGGGLYNGGTLTVSNCTFSGNAASGGDGGDDFFSTNPGDGGNGAGGAIYTVASGAGQSLTLTACTLSSNAASGGQGGTGDEFSYGANGVGYGGGAMRGSGTATVRGTIIAGNSATSAANGHDANGAFTSQGFNFIGKTDGSSGWLASDIKGTNAAPKNPKLDPLTDNGGQTNTHALLIGSTAIDKGKAFGLTTDQRNQVRPFNDPAVANGAGSDGSDIGAFERQTPRLFVSDVTITEGNSGTLNAVFTVNLFDAKAQTVTVSYATATGTTNPATAADYTAVSGTLSFSPGQTAKTVNVPVKGDTLDELNETFFVNLSNASGAPISDAQGLGTIVDNDATPHLSINDVTVTEGNSGTLSMVFTVTLSAASGLEVKVNYATANGTTNPATQPADYTATSGQLVFASGQASKLISVPIRGDLSDEPNETLRLNLSASVNAALADTQAIGTINDNDPLPSLRINNVTVTEGNSGVANAAFTVSLSVASGKQVQVNYATADGTATQPADYTATSGTLIIQPNTASAIILVPIKGETVVEPNETFLVNLMTSVNATVADNQGVGTITNDDGGASVASPESEVQSPTSLAGAEAFVSSQSVQLTFNGALDAAAASDVTHYKVTVNGFVVASSDASYDATPNTVTLLLPDGTLKAGDEVAVAWRALPESGSVTILAD